jgi:hypothetical protein
MDISEEHTGSFFRVKMKIEAESSSETSEMYYLYKEN